MNKTITWIVIVLFIIGIFWWFGQFKYRIDVPRTEGEPIKIGVIISGTGVGAHQGEWARRGILMAEREINQHGGIDGRPVQLIIEDSKTETATAASAVNKLIGIDGVKIIIGDSWTSTSAVIEPVINERGVLLIAPLVTLDSLTKDDLLFRLMPITKDMMTPLANYVYTKMGARTVAFMRQATPFGVEHARDFEQAFESLGGRIVGEEEFEITSTDLRSYLTKIKSAQPEVVFNLHATGPAMGVMMKQAKELGLNTKWIGSWGSENGGLLKEYGQIIEGLVYPYPYDVDSGEEPVQEFATAYEREYKEKSNFVSANFYDSLQLAAMAIEEVGEDPVALKNFLLDLGQYRGASGSFSFDANGDVKRPIIIKTVLNGQFVKREE